MSKVYFVTFGCDTRFKQSRQRLVKEAKNSGWFDDIFVYEPENLLSYNKSFEGKGAGYWWWKSVVQSLALNEINEGDLLLYTDAGTYINRYASNIFDEYVNIVNTTNGVLTFNCNGSIEKNWTKRDVFKLLDCETAEFTDSSQIGAGLVLYKKNELSVNLVNEFVKVTSIPHMINDDDSYNKNYEGFIEHRHDQSVFSLLLKKFYKKSNITLINHDESYQNEIDLVKKWMMDTSMRPRIRSNTEIENLKHPFIHARLNDTTFTWV